MQYQVHLLSIELWDILQIISIFGKLFFLTLGLLRNEQKYREDGNAFLRESKIKNDRRNSGGTLRQKETKRRQTESYIDIIYIIDIMDLIGIMDLIDIMDLINIIDNMDLIDIKDLIDR